MENIVPLKALEEIFTDVKSRDDNEYPFEIDELSGAIHVLLYHQLHGYSKLKQLTNAGLALYQIGLVLDSFRCIKPRDKCGISLTRNGLDVYINAANSICNHLSQNSFEFSP